MNIKKKLPKHDFITGGPKKGMVMVFPRVRRRFC